MNPIELGKFIANLRNEKNLTQEELAEKLFIDKRKISRWECGTSIPEFEMLIKLSEILDVSLYELSICKRIENESLTRRTINKFKSLKDFKKYKAKKKIKYIFLVIFFILFIITATFTIKHSNTVEIYELESADENYYIEGNYIKAKDFNLFYLDQVYIISNDIPNLIQIDNCELELYNNNARLFHIIDDNKYIQNINQQKPHYELLHEDITKSDFYDLKIVCKEKKKNHTIKIKFEDIYCNKILNLGK